ncbi:MAG: N-6 DNA methylase [Paludibacteraceae bacterium]|nr:N-6 DNA methylase [Paludibacteraceae bacterium]
MKDISIIKKTGATFTPSKLANYLSNKLIDYYGDLSNKIVLDPACGDGSLLISIAEQTGSNVEKLIGFDTNKEYVTQTKKNLEEIGISNYEIGNEDFLEISNKQNNLFSSNSLSEYADIIIANPPYVRTQNLGREKSRQIAKNFNLTGKVDLYYPFLIGMTNVLKKGGILGVITSNRYLTTKSGSDIRKFLLDNYDILEVIDLGDSQLFDAAVLPAILIGRKKTSKTQLQSTCKFVKIYEIHNSSKKATNMVSSVYDILSNNTTGIYWVGGKVFDYTTGILTYSSNKTDVWKMTKETESKFIDVIHKNTYCHICDKFKVRVGIKSCADNVFLNPNLNGDVSSEQELFKPMISRENIQRWSCDSSSLMKVLYPHYDKGGSRCVYDIDKYPITKEYLLKHKEQLEGRSYLISAGRKWYEMWVPQNPALWKFPKIVFPDISVEAQFAYDESGAIVNGNCYWIEAKNDTEKDLLLLIQGIANSELMSTYHDLCFNNKLYSGRRRYLSQYVEKYPIPNPNSDYSKNIIRIVEDLNAAKDVNCCSALIQKLNENVRLAFGVTD